MTFFLYRLARRAAEVLPSRAIGAVCRFVALLAVHIRPRQADLVRGNLTRVLGSEPRSAMVREAFASYLRYWINAFRLPVVPDSYFTDRCTSEGFEHIQAARAEGNGVILALPHIGNWDAAGAWLVRQDVPLTVVVERLASPRMLAWFADLRTSLGLQVVVNDAGVARKLLGALHDNHAIALLCDRDVDGTGGTFALFGEETTLPRGPATLALRTGAALLPAAAYESDNGWHIVIRPPVAATHTSEGGDIDRVTKDLVRELEELIRRAPEQWHVFQPNWPADR